MTAAWAAPKVACPEVYAGNAGEKRLPSRSRNSGSQVGSPEVPGLSSPSSGSSASRIAVCGRHRSRSVEYFASQATMAASAMASATRARSRAFSTTSRPFCSDTILVISNSCPGGLKVPSTSLAQNSAISVCSGLRVAEFTAPSSLTSLNWAAYSGLRSSSVLDR
jgi:hypothetical protein